MKEGEKLANPLISFYNICAYYIFGTIEREN
jgi:hypothetical protein